eukprot:scaffold2261_cov124-Cylindrotheca_fusiformis.AAC.12
MSNTQGAKAFHHAAIIRIKRIVMVEKCKHKENQGTEPTGKAGIDPFSRFGFRLFWHSKIYSNSAQPVQQSLQKADLSRQEFKPVLKNAMM